LTVLVILVRRNKLTEPTLTLKRIFRVQSANCKMEALPKFDLFNFGKRLFHFGPIASLALISYISIVTISSAITWWPLTDGFFAWLNVSFFTWCSMMVLSNFFCATYFGPGFLRKGWAPMNHGDKKYLQYCKLCKGYKAPRSHHCRKCNRCVLKMDHHCPWINNCCGFLNHRFFFMFLFWIVISCLHATIIQGCCIYKFMFSNWYSVYYNTKWQHLNISLLLFMCFSIALTLGVLIAVGLLFICHLKLILRNRTGIEVYICEKANLRKRSDEFVYPYDLGWKANFRELWRPSGDGICYPVKCGSSQYDLTIEQLEQKRQKKNFSEEYEIVRAYNGRVWAFKHGFSTCALQPWLLHEFRLPVAVGERVLVSRWSRHWMYGILMLTNCGDECNCHNIRRGWFPKSCARLVEMSVDNSLVENNNLKRKLS
ncbi:Palmitoyltransferase ZDHHC6, partial [Trichinella britovi]